MAARHTLCALFLCALYLTVTLGTPLSDVFKDVLVIMYFNWGHYKNCNQLLQLWNQTFPNIRFYGPASARPAGRDLMKRYKVHTGDGMLENEHVENYIAPALAYYRYPNFKGYLFMHDDMFVHPGRLEARALDWNRTVRSLSKSSPSAVFPLFDDQKLHELDQTWPVHYKNAIRLRDVLQDPDFQVSKALWEQSKICDHGRSALGGDSDFYFIPRAGAQAFAQAAHVFYRHNVSLEIATPTLLQCIAAVAAGEQDWTQTANLLTLWGDKRNNIDVSGPRFLNGAFEIVHPVKLAKDVNFRWAMQVIHGD